MPGQILRIILASLLFINEAYCQPPAMDWQKCYGGLDADAVLNMQQTNDGGYIFCGSTWSNSIDVSGNYGGGDCWIVKLNSAGTIVWQKCLGGTGGEMGMKIEQTTDGGYILGAVTTSKNSGVVGNTHGAFDYWVVKLDNSGQITWQKAFGGSLDDFLRDIHQTTDGGYIVCGSSASQDGDIMNPHAGFNDAWILKLDVSGNIQWQRSLGGTDVDDARRIRQTADGGYIFTGASSSTDGDITIPGPQRIWTVKLDASGNIQWQKKYGSGGLNENANDIVQTGDGGYIISANSVQNALDVTGNHGDLDLWIVKLDASGGIVWQQSLGGSNSDFYGNILLSDDGGYFVTSTGVYSTDGDITGNHGNADAWIAKLSSTGSLLWQKAMGGIDHEDCTSLCSTADHALLIAGSTRSNSSGDIGANNSTSTLDDIWVIKLAPELVPITWSDFNATAKEQHVYCTWKTYQEINSSHFVIERSADAGHFLPVGTVQANENSVRSLDYSFTDKNAFSLTGKDYLYYRLKMVDLNGSFKYSDIAGVHIKMPATVSIYPNPVVDIISLDITSSFSEDAVISFIGSSGKKLYQQNITIRQGKNIFPMNTAFLPDGSYFLVVNGRNNYVLPFIKRNK